MGREAEIIGALEDLFDRERAMLRAGEVAGLDRIAAQKEYLAQRLGPRVPPEVLARLRARAVENAGLMRAAAEGILSAINTVRAIREGAGSLRTYGADGAERTTGAARTVERRA